MPFKYELQKIDLWVYNNLHSKFNTSPSNYLNKYFTIIDKTTKNVVLMSLSGLKVYT